jgi:hypothetical protein
MPVEEKSKKPEDTPFKQQKLPSWQPVLTPLRIIVSFILVGIIFIPLGVSLRNISDSLHESVIRYDGDNMDVTDCAITTANEGTQCTVAVNFDEDWNGPVYVYYELENYYQNHRRYVQSRDALQLSGEDVDEGKLDKCEPLIKNGSMLRNPCGLIAASYFNDVITLQNTFQGVGKSLDESDIAWESDIDEKFKQPSGFKYKDVTAETTRSAADCQTYWNMDNYYVDGSTYYCYEYPNDDTTQYLYEMFPQISPILGVTDEHFIVWMRTAALPKFRKLYGKIDADFKKGNKLEFSIVSNFEVSSYDASKSLVLSMVGEFGGKNASLGTAYIVVGAISLVLGIAFFVKHIFFPRTTQDAGSLKWE